MRIEKGKRRICFIFPYFVIKLPTINPIKAWRKLYCPGRGLRLKHLAFNSDSEGSPRYWLFRGMRCNWLEFIWYLRYRYNFMTPTYFSFFGLFNIQRYVKDLDDMQKKKFFDPFLETLSRIIGESIINCSYYHDTTSALSWGFVGETVKIRDYAHINNLPFFRKHGHKIDQNLTQLSQLLKNKT